MIVLKFGGTSVSTAPRIKTICDIVAANTQKNSVVVVSALNHVSDLLFRASGDNKSFTIRSLRKIHLDLINNVFGLAADRKIKKDVTDYVLLGLGEIEKLLNRKKIDNAVRDRILSFGEILSSYIVTRALISRGTSARQIIADELIVTDNNFGAAKFLAVPTQKKVRQVLEPMIKKGAVPVVTGSIAAARDGRVTTLGRGGSDYSAVIIGSCLAAEEIKIWTDADGIFSADPRIVRQAKLINSVSFTNVLELAAFREHVLYPQALMLAAAAGIPLRILNILNPKSLGTQIIDKPSEKLGTIMAISFKRKVALVDIYSSSWLLSKTFPANVFEIFSNENVSVNMVNASGMNVSVILERDDRLDHALIRISKFASVLVMNNLGVVVLTGKGIITYPNIAKRIFDTLDKEKISVKMIMLRPNDINLSLVVQSNKVEAAVRVLYKVFIG